MFQSGSVVPSSGSATREIFARWSTNQDPVSGVGFAIDALSGATGPGALLGHLALFDVRPRTRSATFAIGLGAEHLGRGYGTDATRVAIDYGFREMNLHRIQLTAFASISAPSPHIAGPASARAAAGPLDRHALIHRASQTAGPST